MYAEVAWELVSSITQVQPQIILDPDYLPDYHSVSYGYDFMELQTQRAGTTTQDFQVLLIISSYLHPEVFYKKGVLRSIGKCIGKHLLQSLLFHKVGGLQLTTLLRKRFQQRCFTVNLAKLSKIRQKTAPISIFREVIFKFIMNL